MYKILFALFISLPIVMTAQNHQSGWQKKSISVDGDLSDWDKQPSYYDATSNVVYGYRNDSTNLYLSFIISEEVMQIKAIHAGFSIELKAKTKPKVAATIDFPVQLRSSNTPGKSEKGEKGEKNGKGNKKEMQQSYKLSNTTALCKGFNHTNGPIKLGEISDKSIAYNVDWNKSDAMTFEIIIPLREIFSEDMNMQQIKETKMALEASFKAIERPSNNQMQDQGSRPSGGGGGGMGGPGGGGMGGPGGGRSSGGMSGQEPGGENMSLMSTGQKIKSKFTLTNSN